MKANTGFTYLLVLFAVTGICLSYLANNAMTFSHTSDGDIGIYGIQPFVPRFHETNVYIVTVGGVGHRTRHSIYANNPTDSVAYVRLLVDGRQFLRTLPPRFRSVPLFRLPVRNRPEVRAEYAFHDVVRADQYTHQHKTDIAGAPADSDAESVA
ncbi:hypothetical protein PtB15_3B358 [Puccinia triticina]|nr:hypothetical protein PtB15_3B358 [Puccinia triticina]